MQQIRLSQLSHGGGCGCKLAPSVLQQLLSGFPAATKAQALPWLTEAAMLAQKGFITGASGRNWKSYDTNVALPTDTQRHLYCDPQASGGLLVACAPDRADALLKTIVASGYPAARIIGEVKDGEPRIAVVA